MAPHQIADVLMPLALDTAYSYAVPPGLSLSDGDVVQVPLGTRETIGVVWSLREGAGSNLKPVTGLVDAPRLEPKLRRRSIGSPGTRSRRRARRWRWRCACPKPGARRRRGSGSVRPGRRRDA